MARPADGDRDPVKLLRAGLFAVFLLAGCIGRTDDLGKFVPREADQYARDYFALIARGEVDSAELKMAIETPHDSARVVLRDLVPILAGAEFDSAVIAGFQSGLSVTTAGQVTRRTLTYQVPAKSGWLWLTLTTEDAGGYRAVQGLHLTTYASDQRKGTGFTLEGKGIAHLLWLLLMVACAGFAVSSATWVAFEKGFPRKWIWVPVALIGVTVHTIDWATSEISHKTFSILLFAIGALKAGPVAPWTLSFAFPAGAVVAIARVYRWRASQRAGTPMPVQGVSEPPPPPGDQLGTIQG